MATTSSVGSTTQSTGTQSATGQGGLASLTPQDFMNMLIAELQNQDPTEPMSTGELLTEIGQIGTVQTNQNLNTTLQSVLLGQNVATAGNLINQTVTGKDSQGNDVTGQVSSVSIVGGQTMLQIGNSTVPLSNLSAIGVATTTNTGGTTT